MIKAVIFDFDLTLVNSIPAAIESYRAICRETGRRMSKDDFMKYIGMRVSDSIHGVASSRKQEEKLWKIFLKIFNDKIPEHRFYGKKIIKFLRSRGIKAAVVSDNSRQIITRTLKYHKVPCELVIADEDMKKGENKHNAILMALKRLRIKKEDALYVGDHVVDIKEARKAGVKVAIVSTGIIEGIIIKRENPDFMLESLDSLKELLKHGGH